MCDVDASQLWYSLYIYIYSNFDRTGILPNCYMNFKQYWKEVFS